jgi:hypothetical protein
MISHEFLVVSSCIALFLASAIAILYLEYDIYLSFENTSVSSSIDKRDHLNINCFIRRAYVACYYDGYINSLTVSQSHSLTASQPHGKDLQGKPICRSQP